MTDGFDQALANAGLALLTADASLVVCDGAVPDGTDPPYVLVYTTVERPTDHEAVSGNGKSSGFTTRWYCHCVGGNAVASRAVAQRVRTALLDVRPTVAGLSTGLIRQAESIPPDRDESTGRLVMDSVQVYELHASA